MKKRATLICLTVICVAVGVYLVAFFIKYGFWVGNYYTTMYFSTAKFQEIQPGMSCEEVLDAVGVPLKRRKLQGGEWYWIYSLPVQPERRYKEFEVLLDSNTNKVVGCQSSVSRLFRDPRTGKWVDWYPPRPAAPWDIAHFDYPMAQGEPPLLNSKSGKPYLIQVMATWCKPSTKGRWRIERLLEDELSDVPVSLLLVSVDESEETLREYLSENEVSYPVAWDPNRDLSRPMNQELIPKYLVLKGKTLYPFDFPHYHEQFEEYYEDLAWFIRYHAGANSNPENLRTVKE